MAKLFEHILTNNTGIYRYIVWTDKKEKYVNYVWPSTNVYWSVFDFLKHWFVQQVIVSRGGRAIEFAGFDGTSCPRKQSKPRFTELCKARRNVERTLINHSDHVHSDPPCPRSHLSRQAFTTTDTFSNSLYRRISIHIGKMLRNDCEWNPRLVNLCLVFH